jgi:stress-induced morphogen
MVKYRSSLPSQVSLVEQAYDTLCSVMIVQGRIEAKLRADLDPELLEVHNESHMHAVPKGSESHFRVLVVSPQFEGLARVGRHRRVHQSLRDELAQGVHALAIDAWTPAEWTERAAASVSPQCLGGSKTQRA